MTEAYQLTRDLLQLRRFGDDQRLPAQLSLYLIKTWPHGRLYPMEPNVGSLNRCLITAFSPLNPDYVCYPLIKCGFIIQTCLEPLSRGCESDREYLESLSLILGCQFVVIFCVKPPTVSGVWRTKKYGDGDSVILLDWGNHHYDLYFIHISANLLNRFGMFLGQFGKSGKLWGRHWEILDNHSQSRAKTKEFLSTARFLTHEKRFFQF